jgi:chemotaxis protein methyltransferase CheR
MRSTAPLVRQRYFKQDGLYYTIDPTVKSMVTFALHNLKDRVAAKRFGQWDIIICRNVMIYFDDEMKKQLLTTFADQLTEDGTLFIGHSETIRLGEAPFSALPIPQGFCYRKAGKK